VPRSARPPWPPALHAGNRPPLAGLPLSQRVDSQFHSRQRRVLAAWLIRTPHSTRTGRAAETSLRPISRYALGGVCAGGRHPACRPLCAHWGVDLSR